MIYTYSFKKLYNFYIGLIYGLKNPIFFILSDSQIHHNHTCAFVKICVEMVVFVRKKQSIEVRHKSGYHDKKLKKVFK